MTVRLLSTKGGPQMSDWSTEPTLTSHQPPSYAMCNINNAFENPVIVKGNQQTSTFLRSPLVFGLAMGLLLGGAVLSMVVTLWLMLPETTNTTTAATTTATVPMVTAFWNFDSNTNDLYNNYNGVAVNTPSYVTGYTGLNNTALNFISGLSQYVTIDNPFLNLTYRSFTVEIWFYPTLLTSGDYGLFGQCQATAMDRCLMYMIRNNSTYLAFHADDQSGVTVLSINIWYHVAFVYDYSTSTQLIYLNGILEDNGSSNPYKGLTGAMSIGAISNGTTSYFSGYIDQVSLVTRTKSAAEILDDATLVCYYSFDSSAYADSGPLSLAESGVGFSIANGTGRINSAISFTSASSYFVVGGLTRLGTVGRSYSISIWIKPTSVNGGTIAHVSKCNNSCSSNWCLAFIGFTLGGQIAIQSWRTVSTYLVSLTGPVLSINVWTHVVQTYSSNNGMSLYINGTLVNQSSTFKYSASSAPDYIYLGSFPGPICVSVNTISMGQYYGLVDEFRLFAREITATEVSTFANP